MLIFPSWFEKALQVLECPKCHEKIRKEHIIAEGIRNSIVHKGETAFFIEHKCPDCSSHATIELTKMCIEEFALEIMGVLSSQEEREEESQDKTDIYESSDKTKNEKKPIKKSKISSMEIDEITESIKNCKTHEEFLLDIGVSQEEIDSYKETKLSRDYTE